MTTKVPQARAPSAVPNLDPLFGPDAPSLPDPGPMADAMQQNPHILHAMQILADLLIDRPDTFVDTTFVTPSSTTIRPTTTGASNRTSTLPLEWTRRRSGAATAT